MPKAEKPVSIWEIVELVTSASESVKSFALQFARKVARLESDGKIETGPVPDQILSEKEVNDNE